MFVLLFCCMILQCPEWKGQCRKGLAFHSSAAIPQEQGLRTVASSLCLCSEGSSFEYNQHLVTNQTRYLTLYAYIR